MMNGFGHEVPAIQKTVYGIYSTHVLGWASCKSGSHHFLTWSYWAFVFQVMVFFGGPENWSSESIPGEWCSKENDRVVPISWNHLSNDNNHSIVLIYILLYCCCWCREEAGMGLLLQHSKFILLLASYISSLSFIMRLKCLSLFLFLKIVC
jgi:hypothetical protein